MPTQRTYQLRRNSANGSKRFIDGVFERFTAGQIRNHMRAGAPEGDGCVRAGLDVNWILAVNVTALHNLPDALDVLNGLTDAFFYDAGLFEARNTAGWPHLYLTVSTTQDKLFCQAPPLS